MKPAWVRALTYLTKAALALAALVVLGAALLVISIAISVNFGWV